MGLAWQLQFLERVPPITDNEEERPMNPGFWQVSWVAPIRIQRILSSFFGTDSLLIQESVAFFNLLQSEKSIYAGDIIFLHQCLLWSGKITS